MNAQITGLRTKYSSTQEDLQSLRSAHTEVTTQYASLRSSYKADVAQLQGRIKELEDDRRDDVNWKKRAEALSIDLEEQRRKAAEGKRMLEDSASDKKGDGLLRDELKRECLSTWAYFGVSDSTNKRLMDPGQLATFAMTQQRINSLETECHELREKVKAADAALYDNKQTERALRESMQTLETQLARARRDME